MTLYDFVQGKVLLNYFADDPTFRGGIAVDMSDLQGNGKQHIITGVGKGGGPLVAVYDAFRTDGFPVPDRLGTFLAGDEADRTGIRVGAGEVDRREPGHPGRAVRAGLGPARPAVRPGGTRHRVPHLECVSG